MKRIIPMFFVFLVFPFAVLAEQQNVPDEVTLRELARDLADVYQQIEDSKNELTGSTRIAGFVLSGSTEGVILQPNKDEVAIRSGADSQAKIITTANKDETLRVLGQANDWYAVRKQEKGSEKPYWGWVNASEGVLVPWQKTQQSGDIESPKDKIFRELTETLSAMRRKYQNNPNVYVEGFTVDVKIPPGVSVQFKFK